MEGKPPWGAPRCGLGGFYAAALGGGGTVLYRGDDAIALVGENKPDVVIAQIDVDLNTAKEVLTRIRSASPDSRIIVLTMSENLRYLQALSRLGIDAYIHKTSSSQELLATIDAASREPVEGNVVVSMPRHLLERLGEGDGDSGVLAARGLPNARIGEGLGISEATVKRHLANVYQKIGVRSRSEAVRRALMEQWIGIGEITSSADGDGSSGA